MSSSTTFWDEAPLLPAIILLFTTVGWGVLESYAIRGFAHGVAGYDFLVESLSDLGVDYRQIHPLKHYAVTSVLYAEQNVAFLLAGAGFALGQIYLLYASRGSAGARAKSSTRTLRLLFTLGYAAGMVLLAQVHGGPREKLWKTIGWHWQGLALAAIAGNLNSVLVGASGPSVASFEASALYRLLSLVLGIGGLFSYYQFATLGTWNYQTKIGLWQRGMVYPVLAWNVVTALSLVAAKFSTGSDQAKKSS